MSVQDGFEAGAYGGRFFADELGAPAGLSKVATLGGGIIGAGVGGAVAIGEEIFGSDPRNETYTGGMVQPCPFGASFGEWGGPDPYRWRGIDTLEPHETNIQTNDGRWYYTSSAHVGPWDEWREGSRWTCTSGARGAVRGGYVEWEADGHLFRMPAKKGAGVDVVEYVGPARAGGEPPPPPPGKRRLRPTGLSESAEPKTPAGMVILIGGLLAAGVGIWAINKYT